MGKTTEKWHPGWTRRQFLTRIGQVGGAGALYETMVALGLVNLPPPWTGPPQLERGRGAGESVLILGAGIGGLTAAYILSRQGYRCHILEAASRAGGRNYTARRGDTVIEEYEDGRDPTYQECKFDDGLYLNLGPGRLPYHHRRVLGYCQDLNVALEPYVMNTTGNLFQSSQSFDQEPVVYRRIQNDTRGFIAELLAKAVNKGALNEELDQDGVDREGLLSLLQKFGPLGVKWDEGPSIPGDPFAYNGSTRSGCGPGTPNLIDRCDVVPPTTEPETTLSQLVQSDFWMHSFYNPIEFLWQPTMFQPVGGMDMIVEGFLRKVGHLITYNAPVVDIHLEDDAVSVTYLDGSRRVTATADHCVSNIPCSVLKDIDNNFDPDFAEAVAGTKFDDSCKVGWQCNIRFWESNKYEIYGGISWTDDIIEQIWYPSNDYFGQKGTITGAYIHGDNAATFGDLGLAERLAVARVGGAKLHDEFNDNTIIPNELGLSIAWQHIPYLKGAWASWGEEGEDPEHYCRLLRPDRRFYVVGDQVSTLPGWQEGAMMSAEHVVELIGGKELHECEDIEIPNTLEAIRGYGG